MQIPAKWARMGMNVEQLFHPTADSYSALFDSRKHGRLLRKYIAEAKRRGLRIILYLNVHIIGPSGARHYREWAQQAADGSYPKLYGTYYACCLNGPWRDRFFNALANLESYDIDGIFLDGPTTIKEGCHCRFCKALYRSRYGKNMPRQALSFDFCRRVLDDFMSETYRCFKRMKPEGIVYMNLGLEHMAASYHSIRESLKYNDWVGTEGGFMFYGPPKQGYLWKPGFAARLVEAVAPDKPRGIFMAADQKPWSWYMHTAAETELCIASSVASGANVWYGLHGASRMLASPGGRAASNLFTFLKKHSGCYDRTMSAARVALFYSFETDRVFNAPVEASDLYGAGKELKKEEFGNHKKAVHGFADWLARRHIAYDIVTDFEPDPVRWQQYDCLIMAGVSAMSDKTAAAIRDYVAGGKMMLATFDSSRYDEHGRLRRDFALRDVLGIHDLGTTTLYGNFNYLVPGRGRSLFKGIVTPHIPAAPKAVDVRLERGALMPARYMKPWQGRYMPDLRPGYPAIVEHRFGKGRSLFFAGNIGEFWLDHLVPEYDDLLANAIEPRLRQPVRLMDKPSPIEMTLRRNNRSLYVHLVNYCSFDVRPIVRIEPRRDLALEINVPYPVRARSLMLNAKLAVRRRGKIQTIMLPVLKGYDVVQVRPWVS